jgi:hypothetical protein
MIKALLPLSVGLLAVALLAVGCGNGPSGTSQTPTLPGPDTRQVTVEQIAKDPAAFDRVSVTTEGDYAVGYCSECFLLKDGVYAVRVEVTDTAPLPPESKLYTRMQVTGMIYVAQGSPNIIAESIEYK